MHNLMSKFIAGFAVGAFFYIIWKAIKFASQNEEPSTINDDAQRMAKDHRDRVNRAKEAKYYEEIAQRNREPKQKATMKDVIIHLVVLSIPILLLLIGLLMDSGKIGAVIGRLAATMLTPSLLVSAFLIGCIPNHRWFICVLIIVSVPVLFFLGYADITQAHDIGYTLDTGMNVHLMRFWAMVTIGYLVNLFAVGFKGVGSHE